MSTPPSKKNDTGKKPSAPPSVQASSSSVKKANKFTPLDNLPFEYPPLVPSSPLKPIGPSYLPTAMPSPSSTSSPQPKSTPFQKSPYHQKPIMVPIIPLEAQLLSDSYLNSPTKLTRTIINPFTYQVSPYFPSYDFYENILTDTKSVDISTVMDCNDPNEVAFMKVKISYVLTLSREDKPSHLLQICSPCVPCHSNSSCVPGLGVTDLSAPLEFGHNEGGFAVRC